MKSLLGIISCLLVLFAGVASAWASCKQVTIASDGHQASSISGHAHDHHPGSNHDHSQHTAMHCPIQQFGPTTCLSPKPDREAQRVSDPFGAEFPSMLNDRGFDRLNHGPPAVVRSSNIPFHLLLSVLRI